MSSPTLPAPPIVPREKLDFDLGGDIPKHWLNNDPFKTRFFDAMSTMFPVGERFFITCVRDFKDRITDPQLIQDIKNFTRQEAQHSMLHNQYNQRLISQGIDVDALLEAQEERMFGIARKRFSRELTLAMTAGAEHVTAIMADCFVERPDVFSGADNRMRALYVWHAMEEMEHKGVAFDVLTGVARASYSTRIRGMVMVTLNFMIHVLGIMRQMIRADGYSSWQRMKIWAKGLWWLYKPGGLFMPMMGQYLSYFKRGFHPWQQPAVPSYQTWLGFLNEAGDPVEASNRLAAFQVPVRSAVAQSVSDGY